MKSKPSIWFMAGAAIAVVLIAGAVVMLVSSMGKTKKVRQQLEQSRVSLNTKYRVNPFPSAENVLRENGNAAKLSEWYGKLVAQASKGQLSVDAKNPTAFMTQLGKVQRDLLTGPGSNIVARVEDAEANAPDFAFGFDRYFASDAKLPPPEHVPRLMEQLQIVEALSRALFAENVAKLRGLRREVFEDSPGEHDGAALANPDAGVMKDGALFAKFHFRIEMNATESALLGVLNRLARHDLFIVVTRLESRKLEDDILPVERVEQAAMGAVGDELLPGEQLTREQRLVCGLPVENPMQVILDVDVYRFRKPEVVP